MHQLDENTRRQIAILSAEILIRRNAILGDPSVEVFNLANDLDRMRAKLAAWLTRGSGQVACEFCSSKNLGWQPSSIYPDREYLICGACDGGPFDYRIKVLPASVDEKSE